MFSIQRTCAVVMLALLAVPAGARAQTAAGSSNPFGLFMATETRTIALPLAETRVRGTTRGFVAQMSVTQTYVNPYDDFIEATYVFPLPEQAAVTSMSMHLSDRVVIAEIKEREEAERVYKEAVSAGRTAALMNQERPNIFTQKVGNIPPGDKIEVELTYVEALPYEAGVSSFVFPTVVGPRYIPGTPLRGPALEPSGRISDTDRVPDASLITPPALAEHENSAHRIDLEIDVEPGVDIAEISSTSHHLDVIRRSKDRATVRIAYGDTVPNKDFILRTDLRGKRPKMAVLAHRKNGGDGYVTLAIQPPSLPAPDTIAAKDLFFVVDNSGSMYGAPLDAAKELIRQALGGMNKDDRFTIMRFSDDVSALSATPLDNTPDNVARGIEFTNAMAGMGGTNMLSGVRRALEGSAEPGRLRIVFFLTDGYIGNDAEILRAVQLENHAQARLFSLGVGSSVNRYLLTAMARLGRGEMQAMRYDEPAEPFVARFYRRVRNPVLTDVMIDWGDLEVVEQTPQIIPDLYDGQPVVVHARYRAPAFGGVELSGFIGSEEWEHTVEVELPPQAHRPEVASLWARDKIRVWMDEESVFPGRFKQEITETALGHSLMSKYTSFVAVDHEIARQAHEPLIPVAQRLPLPDGVSRLALGSLSRRDIPPGDPIISIAAPEDARRVTAYFPFGLVKDLAFDPVRGVWRGRFLVPAGIDDGAYTIVVGIESRDGRRTYRRESYNLDSAAEEFGVHLSRTELSPGDRFDLEVDAVEAAAEVYVDCPELGWNRVELEVMDDDAIDWIKELMIDADTPAGSYRLRIVVRDRAGNRLERFVRITVGLVH